MTKKKLLIATDCFLPRWDGISRFLIEIIPKLRHNFDVTVVAPNFGGEDIEIEGVKIVRLELHKFSIGDYQPPKFHSKKIDECVEDADIVFTQSIGSIGGLAIRSAYKQKKPVIAYIHSIEWELVAKSITHAKIVEPVFYSVVKAISRNLYNKCSLLITPSTEISEILKHEGIKTLKTVVHLGIDLEKFNPCPEKKGAKEKIGINPKNKVIGFVGRIGREKDLMTLYNAFLKMQKKTQKC